MKKILIAFGLIIPIVGIAPKFIAPIAQQNYQNLVQQLDESGATIITKTYQEGWFSAKAVTEFKPAATSVANAEKFTIKLVSDIQHGPFSPIAQAATVNTQVYLSIDDEQTKSLPINIKTDIALSGDAFISIDSPEIKYPHPANGDELIIAPFKGHIDYHANTKIYDIDMNLPKIHSTGSKPDEILNVDNIQVKYNAQKSTSGLLLGDGVFSFQRFFVGAESKPLFAINKMLISGELKEEGQYTAINVKYKIADIKATDETYSNIILDIDLHNIMSSAVLALQKGISDIQKSHRNEQEAGMAMLGLYMQEIPKIMQADPGLSIKKLSVMTPEGALTGKLNIDTLGLKIMDIMGGAGAILQKITADGEFSMPEALLIRLYKLQITSKMAKTGKKISDLDEKEVNNTIQQHINSLIDRQFMIRQGDMLQSTIKIINGEVTINGQIMSLSAM